MSKTVNLLTACEQRGKLTFIKGDYTYQTVQGWFYRNGDTVIMRKIGGRNRYAFKSLTQILDFELYKEEGK